VVNLFRCTSIRAVQWSAPMPQWRQSLRCYFTPSTMSSKLENIAISRVTLEATALLNFRHILQSVLPPRRWNGGIGSYQSSNLWNNNQCTGATLKEKLVDERSEEETSHPSVWTIPHVNDFVTQISALSRNQYHIVNQFAVIMPGGALKHLHAMAFSMGASNTNLLEAALRLANASPAKYLTHLHSTDLRRRINIMLPDASATWDRDLKGSLLKSGRRWWWIYWRKSELESRPGLGTSSPLAGAMSSGNSSVNSPRFQWWVTTYQSPMREVPKWVGSARLTASSEPLEPYACRIQQPLGDFTSVSLNISG